MIKRKSVGRDRPFVAAVACCWLLALLLGVSSGSAETLTGVVRFAGTLPEPEAIEVALDVGVCGREKHVQSTLVGPEGGLKDVLVRLLDVTGKVEPGEGLLNQVDCDFEPRVQILPVGSTLQILSSDTILHNSHGFWEDDESTVFNLAAPFPGVKIAQKLERAGHIWLRCDAGHTWMRAHVWVTEHPYYALTNASGQFEITGVAPGTHRIELWHDALGSEVKEVVVKQGDGAGDRRGRRNIEIAWQAP